MKTKEQELVDLLDVVFASGQEPDWSFVREKVFRSRYPRWLMTELLRLVWLCSEDQAAFDEEIWRLTNEAQ